MPAGHHRDLDPQSPASTNSYVSRQAQHPQLVDFSSLNSSLQDIHMSTKPIFEEDSNDLQLRATAKKYASYRVPEPEPYIPSSVVRRSFPEFEYAQDIEMEDDSLDLELPRGLSRGTRMPSSKLRNSIGAGEARLDGLDSSLYDVTPRRPKPSRTGLGLERGSLTKKENIRRMPSSKYDRVQSQSDPNGRRGDRMASGTVTGYTQNYTNDGTDSFAIPNRTEFMEMVRDDLADSPLPRHRQLRYSSNPNQGQQPYYSRHFADIEGVPVPEDEQRIIKQLTLLQDKIEGLERDKSELEEKNEEYQKQIFELRAQIEQQTHLRRSDSALGSSDGDSTGPLSGKTQARLEVIRLNAMVTNLQTKLTATERSKNVAERTAKRLQDERAKTLSTHESSSLQQENVQLRTENDVLRTTIDELNHKVSILETELDETHNRHFEIEKDLKDKLADNDADLLAENQTLHDQLAKLKFAYQKESGKIHQEAQSRRAAEAASKAEYAKLQAENERLQIALREAREKREQELLKWESREDQLRAKLHPGDKNAQKKVNIELGRFNDELKVQLAQLQEDIKANSRRGSQSGPARSRSRSRTRDIATSSRSAAVSDTEDGMSDAESTTNISILLRKAKKTSTSYRSTPPVAEADTFLELPAEEVLANVRMNIEQEHRARKARQSASQVEEPSLSRKSSLKNHTRQNSRNILEEEQHSIRIKTNPSGTDDSARRSSAHIRRHSGAADFTSAFLVQDFTLHHSVNPASGDHKTPHDANKCTVCRRIVLSHDPAAQVDDISLRTPVPVSSRPEHLADIDATPRPSEPPLRALYRLIQSAGDEIVHLKLELRAAERRVEAHDPSQGKRERERLHRELEKVNRALESKEADMYALYDVLEGHKGAAATDLEAEREQERFERDDTVTEEVKEIVRELRSGARSSRRVTIREPERDERNDTGTMGSLRSGKGFMSDEQSEDDEEERTDTWRGFQDVTESLRLNGGGNAIRVL